MANGVYGTNIPTAISNNDIVKYVDIFYSYSETQNSSDIESSKVYKLDSENLRCAIQADNVGDIVEGLYNLKLPTNIFGKKGFYTVYIKPKEIPLTILDVSTLTDFPNIRGIIIDSKELEPEIANELLVNNSLVGYRIIYKKDDGTRSKDIRFVTSNNKCEPVVNVSTSSNAKTYSYRYNENSKYSFLTLTPSTSLSYKQNSTPYIGKPTQEIYLVNTFFEPIQLDIQMVEHDAETLANLIDGSQLRDLNKGLITTFNKNNEIVSQHEVTTLKETTTGSPQYELKENKSNNIDFSQTITDKLD